MAKEVKEVMAARFYSKSEERSWGKGGGADFNNPERGLDIYNLIYLK